MEKISEDFLYLHCESCECKKKEIETPSQHELSGSFFSENADKQASDVWM